MTLDYMRGLTVPASGKKRLETTQGTGTGLGLSIADRIIADHSGRILFYSSAERGTTVRVELPMAELPADDGPTTTLLPVSSA